MNFLKGFFQERLSRNLRKNFDSIIRTDYFARDYWSLAHAGNKARNIACNLGNALSEVSAYVSCLASPQLLGSRHSRDLPAGGTTVPDDDAGRRCQGRPSDAAFPSNASSSPEEEEEDRNLRRHTMRHGAKFCCPTFARMKAPACDDTSIESISFALKFLHSKKWELVAHKDDLVLEEVFPSTWLLLFLDIFMIMF